MSTLYRPPLLNEHDGVRTRIQSYARLMALIADQLEALDQGRLARYHELAAERDRLQHELGDLRPAGEEPVDVEGVEAVTPLLHQTVAEMEARAVSDEWLRGRLAELRDASLQAIRGLELRRATGGDYGARIPPDSQFDVRR